MVAETRRVFAASVAAATLAALVVCSPAAAHGGGGALGFRSTVTGISPAVSGVSVTVLDYDDRLELRNETGRPLIVFGYEGEPYLAFRDGKVYRNTRSPATYLNDDRFGNVELPATADPKAKPLWDEVSPREIYDWHDHRIHWMSPKLPTAIDAAKDEPQHVFKWAVPLSVDGSSLAVSGSLDYVPPSAGRPTLLLVVLALVVVGGAVLVWLRRPRRTR